jgi:two-component system LytT family response regulator
MSTAKWRVLIADDEPAARRGVRQLLEPFADFTVVGECRDGSEVLAWLARAGADVLFLDIQMPETDGFDVIRRRSSEQMPAVVFLTAFEQFALRAFDAEAVDYLVKPVTASRFATTMERLTRRLGGAARAREPAIIVTTARGALVLELRDIEWIEAADYYARVWVGTRSYLLRESLDELERRVAEHGFVRAHRSALVRVAAVRALTRVNGDLVAMLATGAKVTVSRRRRAAMVEALRAGRSL